MDFYKRILYITEKRSSLSVKTENLIIELKNKTYSLPFRLLDSILVFSPKTISVSLLEYCYKNSVGITAFNRFNEISFRLVSVKQTGKELKQLKVSLDDSKSLTLSKEIVNKRIRAEKKVLDNFRRNHREECYLNIDKVREDLKNSVKCSKNCLSKESLRGIEGSATRKYFSCFDQLILRQKDTFTFNGRSKRPPEDEVNVLLSYFYTVLTNLVSSIILALGFNPNIGVYHTEKASRESLACDLVEPFRSSFVDRFILNLINNKKIDSTFFNSSESAIVFKPNGIGKLLFYWEEYLNEEFKAFDYNKRMTRKAYLVQAIKDMLEMIIKDDCISSL